MFEVRIDQDVLLLENKSTGETIAHSHASNREELSFNRGILEQYLANQGLFRYDNHVMDTYERMGVVLQKKSTIGLVVSRDTQDFSMKKCVSALFGKGLNWMVLPERGGARKAIVELLNCHESVSILVPNTRGISQDLERLIQKHEELNVIDLLLNPSMSFRDIAQKRDQMLLDSVSVVLGLWNGISGGIVSWMMKKAQTAGKVTLVKNVPPGPGYDGKPPAD